MPYEPTDRQLTQILLRIASTVRHHPDAERVFLRLVHQTEEQSGITFDKRLVSAVRDDFLLPRSRAQGIGRGTEHSRRASGRHPTGALKFAARLLPARVRRDCLDEWKDHVIEAEKAGQSARMTRVSILFRALLPLAVRSRMRIRRRSVRKP
ncbi:MAG: hypothetical protein M3340_07515 [Actinomycetota bacterium]|nr:hypothetical protein [Actinomycetota bacterium]